MKMGVLSRPKVQLKVLLAEYHKSQQAEGHLIIHNKQTVHVSVNMYRKHVWGNNEDCH